MLAVPNGTWKINIGSFEDFVEAVNAVRVLVHTILNVQLCTFKVVFEDEVGNTSNSVRTVNSGSTTGQDVDALNKVCWNQVDVWSGGCRGTIRKTTTVDQCQRTNRTQTAKVELSCTGRAVGDFTSLSRENLWQVVCQLFDVDCTLSRDLFVANCQDGVSRCQVRVDVQACTRNDDLIFVGVVLGESRSRHGRDAQSDRRSQEAGFHAYSHNMVPCE